MDAEAYQLHTYWTATKVARGHAVGPEASCNKIFWSETDVAIHTAALDLLGPEAELLDAGAPGEWLDGYLFSLAGPIYAGTNEIQRNVVAERLLGLPAAEPERGPTVDFAFSEEQDAAARGRAHGARHASARRTHCAPSNWPTRPPAPSWPTTAGPCWPSWGRRRWSCPRRPTGSA